MSICPMCERKWEGWGGKSTNVRAYFKQYDVHLTSHEAHILAVLTSRNRVVSQESLIDIVWGDDEDGGPETVRNVLRVLISRIRKKIAKLPLEIVNVHGAGYMARNTTSLPGLKTLAYTLLITLFLSFPVLAVAQVICGDSKTLGPGLTKQYGEERVSAAMTAEKKLLERYENPVTGSWTLIVYPNGAKACVVAHGTGWYEKKVAGDPGA